MLENAIENNNHAIRLKKGVYPEGYNNAGTALYNLAKLKEKQGDVDGAIKILLDAITYLKRAQEQDPAKLKLDAIIAEITLKLRNLEIYRH